jgi:hypothetical protein
MPITRALLSSPTQEYPARICCLCNTRQRRPNLEFVPMPHGPPADQPRAIGSSPAANRRSRVDRIWSFKTRRRSRRRRPPSTVPRWTGTPDSTASRAQPRTRPTTFPRARFRDERAFQTTSGRRPLGTSRSSSLDVRFRCSSQGRSAGVGGRRARSREGGRRVLSRLSPPHRAFIGRVLRDTRRRLHRERRPYAGGVPARGSLPYAASAWRGGQPALGVA